LWIGIIVVSQLAPTSTVIGKFFFKVILIIADLTKLSSNVNVRD
jgi:hypothetical protein